MDVARSFSHIDVSDMIKTPSQLNVNEKEKDEEDVERAKR